ncbi:MAG TPA: N-6 DNA methylase [Magnetospirillaceae bacterium]|nr:N-6 DNA methylase [Magnetospirillaceae bacterium]
MVKKEETNDIVQNLYSALAEVGIDKVFCKQDVTTQNSLLERGDIWVSLSEHTKKTFERDIVCLIEAKHKKCVIGDAEWQDAMRQGKSKAAKQNLPYYVVTNCKDLVRFYNAANDEEVALDGMAITKLQPIKILIKALAQISENNSDIKDKIEVSSSSRTESDFRKSLYRLKEIYRACAIKDSEDKINTTVSFIILKYIAEMEQEERHFIGPVKLWNDYGPNFKSDISGFISDISNPEYGTFYTDFHDMIEISGRLTNNYYAKIHAELDKYHFHGCGFDIYGAIYEEFASKKEKKEFGEYYTRRHITKVISELLLKNELYPRDIKICDPACGTPSRSVSIRLGYLSAR